jgi:hypothetical protein
LPTSVLSLLQEPSTFEGAKIKSLKLEILQSSEAGLFTWTLTNPARAFTSITPVFTSREELLHCTNAIRGNDVGSNYSDSSVEAKITQIALAKMNDEWRAWVDVHEELPFDEQKLDNMLMAAVYRIIIERDEKMCVLCHASTDLTIHHIIQRRRNFMNATPPFGRSVPTNLITLCRSCHAIFDPMILS